MSDSKRLDPEAEEAIRAFVRNFPPEEALEEAVRLYLVALASTASLPPGGSFSEPCDGR